MSAAIAAVYRYGGMSTAPSVTASLMTVHPYGSREPLEHFGPVAFSGHEKTPHTGGVAVPSRRVSASARLVKKPDSPGHIRSVPQPPNPLSAVYLVRVGDGRVAG